MDPAFHKELTCEQERESNRTFHHGRDSNLFWTKCAQGIQSQRESDDEQRLGVQRNNQGILECRGRFQGHYPIYLPNTHPYTTKLVEEAHYRTLHRGVSLTIAKIRERYWVPRLRRLAKG